VALYSLEFWVKAYKMVAAIHRGHSPFEVLLALDKACRERGVGLPVHEEVSEYWPGTGFRLRNQHCVAPLGEIAEVLRYPQLSRVPRSREWVRGVANVRGSLLPIIDLNAFLDGRASLIKRDSRVLVIEQGSLITGLLVDEVLGMKYFKKEEAAESPGHFEPNMQPYLSGLYQQGGLEWGVFSVANLVRNPAFLHASV
jgi:twitching motility protein PilI